MSHCLLLWPRDPDDQIGSDMEVFLSSFTLEYLLSVTVSISFPPKNWALMYQRFEQRQIDQLAGLLGGGCHTKNFACSRVL